MYSTRIDHHDRLAIRGCIAEVDSTTEKAFHIKFQAIHETLGKQYHDFWIPKSIIKKHSTLPFTTVNRRHIAVHKVTIPDWWYEKNSIYKSKDEQLEFFRLKEEALNGYLKMSGRQFNKLMGEAENPTE